MFVYPPTSHIRKTSMTNTLPIGFKGRAKKLEDIDLPRIAWSISCGEDEVHMLMDVETSGSGFDSEGRPEMLFEPHKFYANLEGAARDLAVKRGLAYPKWGTRPYPKDSYPRLAQAMQIDVKQALKSCSWGAGQVMGAYYKMLGYATVEEMVSAFCDDEDNHIEGMIAFVKASHIDDELRLLAHKKGPTTPEDCAVIARVYNGAGYRVNQYHIKMAAAHNKWRKINDTPFDPKNELHLPALPTAPKPLPPPTVAVRDGVLVQPVAPVLPLPAGGSVTPEVIPHNLPMPPPTAKDDTSVIENSPTLPKPTPPPPPDLPMPKGTPAQGAPKFSFWQWLIS
jgi:hypothetical protein